MQGIYLNGIFPDRQRKKKRKFAADGNKTPENVLTYGGELPCVGALTKNI